jgi:hypothetical protein
MKKPPKGGKAEKVKESDEVIAERRRQQQVAAKAELRARMEIEVKNSKINKLKIQNQWRKIMRLTKAESLRKDVEILSQNHERDVDRKDAILQMLDRDLEEAEDQFQMALRTHLQNIDALIRLQDSRLYVQEKAFQQELRSIQADFQAERDTMQAKFKIEKKELTAVVETIEHEETEREVEARHAFEQLREEARNRNLEEINMLRISLDTQIEDLESNFESEHISYLQQTSQRTHDFKELTQNDQRLTREIETKKKKIDVLQTGIQQWRAKIRQLNRETEERTRLLLDEKQSIQKHYQQLKQRIQTYRGTQNQTLLSLSQSAHECKVTLGEKLDLARRVLHMSELARRLETEQESIMPFVSSLTTSRPPGNANGQGEGHEEGEHTEPANELEVNNAHLPPPPPNQSSVWTSQGSSAVAVPIPDRMQNFFRKYNKALLDTIAVEKERDRLALENTQLQELIAQYISGTQISDEVLAGDNPLFVVNGRTNFNHAPPVRSMRPLIQDGNIINATVARQSARR